MSWIRSPLMGGSPVGLPPLLWGSPGLGPVKSDALSFVSVVPPTRSKELSPFAVGVAKPVPSRQGLAGEPTPSRITPSSSTIRIPDWLPAAKSVMPEP